MRIDVPENDTWLPGRKWVSSSDGIERDGGDEQRARQGDAGQHLGQVALGLGTGPDARDEAALLAQGVGLLGRDRR